MPYMRPLRFSFLLAALLALVLSLSACEANVTSTSKSRANDAINGAIEICGTRDNIGSIDGLEEQQDDWLVTCEDGAQAGPHFMDN